MSVEELKCLKFAVEMLGDDDYMKARSENVASDIFSCQQVVADLIKKGWSDDEIKAHFVTDTEIEFGCYVNDADLCLNCADPEDYIGQSKNFCVFCEALLTKIPLLQQRDREDKGDRNP